MIQLGGFDTMDKGYLTGYHYELLGKFAQSLGDSARIDLVDKSIDCRDSLILDSLDILVMPTGQFEQMEGLKATSLDDTSIVWVTKDNPVIDESLTKWFVRFRGSGEFLSAQERYFHGFNPFRKGIRKDHSIISPYDDIIKQASRKMGWDWKLFAALIWTESRFRIQVESPRGAFGLMQMMPHTASRYEIENLLDPEDNINAGAAYIARLQNLFRDNAADSYELIKYTLAAYNAGEGRVMDCIRFARTKGVDDSRWDSLCSVMHEMDQDPEILATMDVWYGPFKGNETRAYVKAVLNLYDIFCGLSPRFAMEPKDTTIVDPSFNEAAEDIEFKEVLLGPDSLSRVNPGDEHARDEQEKHDHEEGENVGGEDQSKVEVDRNE